MNCRLSQQGVFRLFRSSRPKSSILIYLCIKFEIDFLTKKKKKKIGPNFRAKEKSRLIKNNDRNMSFKNYLGDDDNDDDNVSDVKVNINYFNKFEILEDA